MPFIGKKKGSSSLQNGTASTPNDDVNPYTKSPYSAPDIISIDVGSKPVRYRVHHTVLSQSYVISEKINVLPWESPRDLITLPDLDEVTAHTIVHHLYSGKYQVLEKPTYSSTGINSSYRLSILVYCAAMRYGLDGLASLAKEKITQWGEHVAILDVLSISREHAFPNLPQEDLWFSEYLQETIKLAAKTNPGLFLDQSFSDQIEGDRKFRHIVVKAMLASQSSETVTPEEQNPVEQPEDTQLENANEDRIEPLRSEDSLTVSSSSLPEVKLEMSYDETRPEPEPAPPEPEPEVIVEETPVNLDEDWGAPLPKKSTKKGKKGKKELVIELEPVPEPEPVPAEPEPEVIVEETTVNVDDMWGSSIKKKSKKKKQSFPEPQLREGW